MKKKIFIIALVLSTLNINGAFAQGTEQKVENSNIKTEVVNVQAEKEPVFESAPESSPVIKTEAAKTVEKTASATQKAAPKKKRKFFFFKSKDKEEAKLPEETSKSAEQPVEQKIVEPVGASAEENTKTVASANKKVKKKKKKQEKLEKEEVIQSTDTASNTESSPQIIQGSVEQHAIISIDDCIKAALANNPSIRSAISDAEIYKTKIGQAWSAYFPTLGASVGYSRNDMLVTNFKFPAQTYNQYQMPNITANLLLFDFGKTKAKADIAKKTYEASKDNIQTSINEVVYSVKEAYYNLLFSIQQEHVYDSTVKAYETHLAQAQAFYNIGTRPKIDVITAEYNLGNAKLNYIKAKNTIDMAYAQLNNAMGLPEYANYDVNDKFDSKAYSLSFDDAIQKAYETRPEYLAAKKKADASKLLIRSSKRAFAPDINAFGSYTSGGKSAADDYGYQFGAQLQYTTTNLYLLKKQVEEARATYKKDAADLEKTRQNVYLEVKQAYIQLNNAKESVPVARLSMQNAEEQYNLASGRYKVGLGDVIELKDAETTYRNAQLDYYNSLLNYNIAAANLERVVGVPLQTVAQSTQNL